MNKILKILSILIIGFVMFSCSTSTNDPVEVTPEEPTYSITFIAEKNDKLGSAEDLLNKLSSDLLNSLPNYKNLKEGTKVELPIVIYITNTEEATLDCTESSTHLIDIIYENKITSVVVGNEDIKIKYVVDQIIEKSNWQNM